MSNRIASILLFVAVLLAYANSLGNGFVWDDAVLISQRSAFYGDARNIPVALVSPDGATVAEPSSYYRPVAALDYFIDEHLFGGAPFAYHLESVVLHLIVTLLFWRLVASSFGSPGLALIAALLFAVHPVNAEAVNFLSARNNLLCAGFLLAALNLLQAERIRGPRVALALGAYCLALLSKEPAIVLPIFVLFWWWPDVTRGTRAVALTGLVAIAGTYLLLRLALLGTIATDAEFRGLGLSLGALYEDLRLLFFPLQLNAFYRVAPAPLDSPRALLVVVCLVGLGSAALFAARPLRWGSAWILVGLAPVANLIPFHSGPVAERYLYIPALGSALVVGYGLHWLLTRFRVVGIATGAVLAALMLSQTVLRNRVWQSDQTLAQSMLAADPRNPTAHVLLGVAYRKSGRYDEALDQYRKALEIRPANARVYANLGNVYLETREFESAIEAFEMALRFDPGMALMHFHIGRAAEESGRTTVAAAHYERFIAETRDLEEPRYRYLRRQARRRLGVLLPARPSAGAARRPNVLFIVVDDLNDWVGALGGHPQARTPNIDRLAKRGVLFTRAYVAAPECNPSRTAVLTGVRPSTSGVYRNPDPWRQALPEAVTLPRLFKDHGYRVLGGGKIFHGDFPDAPSWHEYHERQGNPQPGMKPVNRIPDAQNFDWAPLAVADDTMDDHRVVSWAISELDRPHDEPFFLACGLFRPHLPWYVPRKYFDLFPMPTLKMPEILDSDLDDVPPMGVRLAQPSRDHPKVIASNTYRRAVRGYLASVAFADAQVGRLLEALDGGPHADDTIVVLWSDHGFHLGEKQHWRKFTLWEESTRVPLIIAAPGVARPGGRSPRTVSLLDLYPTLADLAGLPVGDDVEGVSLRPLLEDPNAAWDRPAVTTHGHNSHAVRSERWRYIRYSDGSEELYDHRVDPREWRNLASDPELRDAVEELAGWLPKQSAPPLEVSLDDPLPLERDGAAKRGSR